HGDADTGGHDGKPVRKSSIIVIKPVACSAWSLPSDGRLHWQLLQVSLAGHGQICVMPVWFGPLRGLDEELRVLLAHYEVHGQPHYAGCVFSLREQIT